MLNLKTNRLEVYVYPEDKNPKDINNPIILKEYLLSGQLESFTKLENNGKITKFKVIHGKMYK